MLAIILATAFAINYGYGHHQTQEAFFNPERLTGKQARQALRITKVEELEMKAAESQAALMAAKEEMQLKKEKLVRLQALFSEYYEHQRRMQNILEKIGLENRTEVKEAIQEVRAARIDVEEKAAEVQAVTGQPMPTPEVPVSAIPQEGQSTAETSAPASMVSTDVATTAPTAVEPASITPTEPTPLATEAATQTPTTVSELPAPASDLGTAAPTAVVENNATATVEQPTTTATATPASIS